MGKRRRRDRPCVLSLSENRLIIIQSIFDNLAAEEKDLQWIERTTCHSEGYGYLYDTLEGCWLGLINIWGEPIQAHSRGCRSRTTAALRQRLVDDGRHVAHHRRNGSHSVRLWVAGLFAHNCHTHMHRVTCLVMVRYAATWLFPKLPRTSLTGETPNNLPYSRVN